ncbi:MAG TPA: DUF2069 domain-containing protein [Gammaproteobacteria bacterium]
MKAVLFHRVALIGFFGLMGTILLWQSWLRPSSQLPVALVLILLLGPLLMAMRGLLHGKPYTHAWVSMLSLFYFCLGIMHAWSEPTARGYGMLLTAFSLMLFNGAIFYVYYRNREP